MPCLDDDGLGRILDGSADAEAIDAARVHADGCDACRALLACAGKILADERRDETTQSLGEHWTTATPTEGTPRRVGSTIGRFVLLEPIGRGGMGAVYAARDETLQRNVAVKVLHAGVAGESASHRDRLLREARAMATVTHPNVVAVHETGVVDGEVFIVMDLVDGMDLRAWCRETRRSVAAVLAVWGAAGRGLAAIHARGLVHRDFKPANVLIGHDGHVRVTDFGLVGMTTSQDSMPELDSVREALGHDQTATGMLVGTPRYMALEQIDGQRVDAAADQFAFCVSLWAELTGTHPFGDGDLIDRRGRIVDGRIEPPPSRSDLPSRVLSVLRRGMAAHPDQRWPAMDPLLAALTAAAESGRKRVRRVGGVLGVTAVLAAGVMIGDGRDTAPCQAPAGGDFSEAWSINARARLRDSIQARPVTALEWPKIEAHIDDYTTQWSAARLEACQATRVRGEVSEELLDRRMVCLHRSRSALSAYVAVVADAAFPAETSALELAYELPSLAPCGDLARLASQDALPSDPEIRAQIQALDAELDVIDLLERAGQHEEARTRLAAAQPQLDALAWPAGRARLLGVTALLDEAHGVEAGVATWRQAYVVAIEAGPFEAFAIALDGAGLLARAHHLEEAGFVLDQAQAFASALGGEPRPGELATYRAFLAVQQRDPKAAEEAVRQAIAALVPTDRQGALADAYGNLGGILTVSGRVEEGRGYIERQVALYRDLYGPDHAKTLAAQVNQAAQHFAAGEYQQAESMAREVLAGERRRTGPATQAGTLGLLGAILGMQGRHAQAVASYAEALTLRRSVLPAGHPAIAHTLTELAQQQYALRDFAGARRSLQEADTLLPADDPSTQYQRLVVAASLSAVERSTARPNEALVEAQRAVALAAALPAELADQGSEAWEALALALIDLERWPEARDAGARAVAAADRYEGIVRYKARLHLVQATALRGLGDLAGARALADAAQRLLADAGDQDCDEWRTATQWTDSVVDDHG